MNINKLPLLGSLLLSGLMTVGACSSSNSSGTGGAGGSVGGSTGSLGGEPGGAAGAAGGATGAEGGMAGSLGGTAGSAGGSVGTGAGGVSGTCASPPPCLAVIGTCAPGGTCTAQAGDSVADSQLCYSNGVKVSSMSNYDPTTSVFTETLTYTKAGVTCFTESFSLTAAGGASGGSGTGTIADSTGATVATLATTSDGTVTSVTCAGGGTYPITDSACAPSASSNASSACTQGVCQ